jgi:hypothetical protein
MTKKFRDYLAEEEYDKQRDADAVSGKPRKLSVGSGGGKPKGYSKDKAEKAALDNIKKMSQFSKEDSNNELNRIRELANIDEETYDGDDFYEAYGDLWFNEDDVVDEAEYQGRKVKLGKPMQGDVKKFKVYVKNPKGNVVKVNFGDPDMRIRKSNPKRRKSFRARHNCDNPGPRTKARYWSCRKW